MPWYTESSHPSLSSTFLYCHFEDATGFILMGELSVLLVLQSLAAT